MDKKVIIGVVAAVLVAAGVFVFAMNQDDSRNQNTADQAQTETTAEPAQPSTQDQQTDTAQQQPSNDTEAAATVTYTSSGFSPEQVTVQQGQAVKFVREGGEMWVASDRHPVHAEYDGTSLREHCQNGSSAFDQCQSGSEFTFTFDKAGTFGFHNHVAPAHSGTVVVE